jgi:quercetin dioxygenase-like cupin family protein
MSDENERPTSASQPVQRTPPRERFEGGEHLFDLAVEGQRLRGEPGGARDGHRQITLFRGGGVSIVLFDFEAGGQLKDHAADGYVTVLLLNGDIRIATAEEQHQMSSGSLLVLRPRIRHDLEAKTASSVLLTVRLDRSEDDRP